MTMWPVTCADILSSPIHSAYNYNNKILNYCYRPVLWGGLSEVSL